MNLEIVYKDEKGVEHKKNERMSYLSFIKHLAIAGQGHMPSISKFNRSLGMFLHYSNYINIVDFKNDFFSIPSGYKYDPTEKSQFSNLVGKAIADFLSKKISGGKITFNYEAAMKLAGHKITGERPDLLCIGKKTFAIEAKGFSARTISNKEMKEHKDQSGKGPIKVDFSVASVSYNLYSKVRVNYYDPRNDDSQDNSDIIKELTKQYYTGLSEYVDEELFHFKEERIGNNNYYKILVMKEKYIGEEVFLLLNKNILEQGKKGIVGFDVATIDDENVYIDKDGVGIEINYNGKTWND